jgi:hypothetical protein
LLSNTDLSDQQREDFQKGKDEAGKARDEALKKAQLDWKSDLETLYKAYPQAQGMFNEKTGAKFSDEDIVAHKGTDYLKSHFQNLDQVTQEGWYRIKNTTSGEMEDIYATVDKDTGEINGAWSKTAGWSGGYTDELKQKVKELGETHESERVRIQNSLSTLTGSTLDSNNQVISSTGDVIGQLKGVQGATDGAITGIIDINGTHMQITSNASGQITTMQQYKGSIDDIPPDADVHINSNASNTISDMQKVKEEVNSVDGKAATVTINTVFSGVATSLGQVLGNGAVNAASEVIKNIPQHYNGTDNAESGINSVGERGMELVLGRRLYNFKGGEKVLNNSQTVNLLKARNKQDNEPFQVKQGQYKLAQPQQVQVVGGNGNSIQVDVQVNSGNQDVEKLIVEVTYEVGRKLKEALINIKK